MKKRSRKQLGKLGEDALRTWAHQAHFTVNKAEEDEKGWDFILQSSPSAKQVYDKRSPGLTCWIQVKATDKRKGYWDIKLSNWEHLIKVMEPAFFLICEFDGENECQRAYLVHVWEHEIYEALKRLRNLSQTRKRPNKATLRLKYSQTNAISELNGQALIRAIKKYAGNSLSTYIKRKQQILETVGYENGGVLVKVSFSDSNPNPNEVIVDFLLGIRHNISSARVEIVDYRFGIEAPELTRVLEESTVEVTNRKPFGDAKIRLSIVGESASLTIKSDIYQPAGLPIEDFFEHGKILFRSKFLDMTLSKNGGEFSLIYPEEEKLFLLSDLQQIASIVALISRSYETNKPVEIRVWWKSYHSSTIFPPFNGKLSVPYPPSEEAVQLVRIIRNAWKVAQYFDIQGDLKVSIDQLFSQFSSLGFFVTLIENQDLPLRLQFISDDSSKYMGRICIPHIWVSNLEDNVLLAGIKFLGPAIVNDEKSDGTYEWVIEHVNIKIVETRILHILEDTSVVAREMLVSLIEDEVEGQQVVLTNDMQSLLND